MADGQPLAECLAGELAHSCAGRTRLRFTALKGKANALNALQERVLQLSSVVDAECRPLTGSLIVAHWGTAEDLMEEGRCAGLFSIGSAESSDTAEFRASRFLSELETSLKGSFGQGFDLRSLAAFAFVIMAIRQIAVGVIAPPAATAIWSALLLLLADKGIEKITNASGPATD